jgi:hypothetical protein
MVQTEGDWTGMGNVCPLESLKEGELPTHRIISALRHDRGWSSENQGAAATQHSGDEILVTSAYDL